MRDRGRSRGIRFLAIGAAALLMLLTGCVGIPTSSRVTVGQALAEQDTGDFQFFPLGPVDGADQEEILSGFVAAFTGSDDDYGVARQFLSVGFAESWDPRSNVTVRTSAQRYTSLDAGTMEYAVNATATVDAIGQLRQSSAPVPLTLRFSFVSERGQWRISAAPDGIVLADATFQAIFAAHTLYFLGASSDALVPNLRWFPAGIAALRVVTAVLAGPPPWLQGAARSAFPEGTRLESPSLKVDSGVAIIDLSTESLAANGRERQLMQLQLSTSLSNVTSIRRVSISVGGAPLVIPDIGADAPQSNPQVDARALVLRDGAFGYLVRDGITPISGLSDKVTEVQPTGGTVARGGIAAAIRGSAGVWYLSNDDAPSVLLDTRSDLLRPSLDDYGFVWVASTADATTVRVYSPTGAAVDLPTGLSPDSTLAAIAVSRDAARLAILATTPVGPRLIVKAIVRDANAAEIPAGLSESVLDVTSAAQTAFDATWVDELSVAVLTGSPTQRSVVVHQVGGQRVTLGQPGDAISLVGGNGGAGLRALSASGSVLARSGNGWTDTRVQVSFIATQR